jgi:shikimate dehydrogenase
MQMENSSSFANYYVIGYPVEHSLSPLMHNAAFRKENLPFEFRRLQVKPPNLPVVLKRFIENGVRGFNVTLPLKSIIMKHLSEITSIAEEVGAVNTVKIEKNKLIGTNTDVEGIKSALNNANFRFNEVQKVILFGSGGAAHSICSIFSKIPIKILIFNRTKSHADQLKQHFVSKPDCRADIEIYSLTSIRLNDILKSADLIINSTPVGMWPEVDIDIMPFYSPQPDQWIFDLVYNPVQTLFVKKSIKNGCKIVSGLDMLVFQAAESFKWWTGVYPNTEIMRKVAMNYLTTTSSV